jgi:hypothetical protein
MVSIGFEVQYVDMLWEVLGTQMLEGALSSEAYSRLPTEALFSKWSDVFEDFDDISGGLLPPDGTHLASSMDGREQGGQAEDESTFPFGRSERKAKTKEALLAHESHELFSATPWEMGKALFPAW